MQKNLVIWSHWIDWDDLQNLAEVVFQSRMKREYDPVKNYEKSKVLRTPRICRRFGGKRERLRLRLFSTEVYNRESIEGTKQSGTRFGEILPLWHQLKCLWQFYESLFSIWQKLLPTWVNFMYNWAIFHGSKWTNYENYKSHLVTLVLSNACFFIIGIV